MILDLNSVRFLMDTGFAKSSWKKWQSTLFQEARKFDRYIFTGDQIEHLCKRLEILGTTLRGNVEVGGPRWDDFVKFGLSPSISLGEGCSVRFIYISGEYDEDVPAV